jgi:hypothetical protein
MWLRENQYVGSDARSEVALDFMPWLSSQVSDRVRKVEESSKVLDNVLVQSLEKAYELFENRKCWIRVLVKRRGSSNDDKDDDNKDGENESKSHTPVGPIPIGPSDTVRDVLNVFESKMEDNISLELLYAGRVLSDAVIVLTIAKDLDLLEVREVGGG